MKPSILILNASLGGKEGNTAALLDRAVIAIGRKAEIVRLNLSDTITFSEVQPFLREANGILVGTGTHWDSWSHLLQRFLEQATPSEGTSLWLGKPVGVIVTMHSVGGKSVLSRLQGVLNTFGCLIPPMSGLVYSLVNQAAIEAKSIDASDLWCPEDVDIVCHNLLAALKPKPRYKAWPVERDNYAKCWIN